MLDDVDPLNCIGEEMELVGQLERNYSCLNEEFMSNLLLKLSSFTLL